VFVRTVPVQRKEKKTYFEWVESARKRRSCPRGNREGNAKGSKARDLLGVKGSTWRKPEERCSWGLDGSVLRRDGCKRFSWGDERGEGPRQGLAVKKNPIWRAKGGGGERPSSFSWGSAVQGMGVRSDIAPIPWNISAGGVSRRRPCQARNPLQSRGEKSEDGCLVPYPMKGE